jgi:deferrochelatase/peroxidase EfeB
MKPEKLTDLPAFSGDQLDPAISHGDLVIQACANDPQVAVHAVRNLVRIAFGRASVRYSQMGFGRTSSTSQAQVTARNMLGFKDGTANIKVEERKTVDEFVWVGPDDGPEWLVDGSYLVTRKIRMLVETWDVETLAGQEAVFGRAKDTGAPLGEDSEFATPDLDAQHSGRPLIADDAHIRLASPEHNGGVHLLRRGYNYSDGVDPTQGNFASGLFFIAFTSDPEHFTKVQRSLAHGDALNEYIEHISSAVFACPRGLADGETWRDQLFP